MLLQLEEDDILCKTLDGETLLDKVHLTRIPKIHRLGEFAHFFASNQDFPRDSQDLLLGYRPQSRSVSSLNRVKNRFTLSKLKAFYEMPNPNTVLEFLNKYPNLELASVLFEAREEVKKHFPSERLSLEVIADPELIEVEDLWLYIFTSLPVKEARQKLKQLDNEWFLDQMNRTNGLFNFNLRFV
jgi:hypothetical protein